jgi:hypothetical protein
VAIWLHIKTHSSCKGAVTPAATENKTVFLFRTQCHAADIAYCTPQISGYLAAYENTLLKALEEAVTPRILLTKFVLNLLKFTTEFSHTVHKVSVNSAVNSVTHHTYCSHKHLISAAVWLHMSHMKTLQGS